MLKKYVYLYMVSLGVFSNLENLCPLRLQRPFSPIFLSHIVPLPAPVLVDPAWKIIYAWMAKNCGACKKYAEIPLPSAEEKRGYVYGYKYYMKSEWNIWKLKIFIYICNVFLKKGRSRFFTVWSITENPQYLLSSCSLKDLIFMLRIVFSNLLSD